MAWLEKLLTQLAALIAAFLSGVREEKLRRSKEEKNEAIEDAYDWANRPRSNDDFHNRLRDLADKSKDNTPV